MFRGIGEETFSTYSEVKIGRKSDLLDLKPYAECWVLGKDTF